MVERFNGFQIYNFFLAGYLNISKNREYINKINVFPVMDGDTGTNMVGTFKTIALNLSSCKSAGELLDRIARLSLEGARGNSGMILSQYLNGMAIYSQGKKGLTPCEMGEIFNKSVDEAYSAVETPREGTILTVMKVWADSFNQACLKGNNIKEALQVSMESAREALKKTPDQLAVLKKHHVVDAGAWGFVSFLEGAVALGEKGRVPFIQRNMIGSADKSLNKPFNAEVHGSHDDLTFRYCTEVLLDSLHIDKITLKKTLAPHGDSLIVSVGAGRSRIHIHTNEPHRVISDLRGLGKIIQQKADDMVRQEQIVNNRLGSIGVLTDSIADIPMEILDLYQIHVVNLSLIWDEEEYLDRITLQPDDFYKMQATRDSFPTSSFPPAAQVERYYEYLLEHYEGLVVLSVSKELSGTWQRMFSSAEKFNQGKKRIAVIDSCLNSVAQGLLVKNIAQKAAEGWGLDQLVEYSEELKKRIKIYVMVKTFKFMIKGGRVSPIKGLLAKILNLKPIVSLDERGKGIAFDKSFSSRGLMKKITRMIKNSSQNKGINEYAVVHAAAPERADSFIKLISGIIDKDPAYVTDISPIVGMHSGQGAVAIGIVEDF